MSSFDEFERRIHWLHELIERNKSVVTWNDRIVDPDNPDRSRQIDVLIKTARSRVIVECRFRARPQDVTWIEELIGRKASLGVDGVIAVSSSGFTEGAIAKARKFGIALREFSVLTEEEVQSWGATTRVAAAFFRYRDVVVTAFVPWGELVDIDALRRDGEFHKTLMLAIASVSPKFEDQLLVGKSADFEVKSDLQNCVVHGCQILSFKISGSVEAFEKTVNVLTVKAYGSPSQSHGSRDVVMEEFDLGDSRVAKYGNEVSIVFDVSGIGIPRDCQFRGMNADLGKVVNGKMEVIGNESVQLPRISFRLAVARVGR